MSILRTSLALTRARIARNRTKCAPDDVSEELTPMQSALTECDMRDPYARALMHALNVCDDTPFDGASFALTVGTL